MEEKRYWQGVEHGLILGTLNTSATLIEARQAIMEGLREEIGKINKPEEKINFTNSIRLDAAVDKAIEKAFGQLRERLTELEKESLEEYRREYEREDK